MMIRHDEKYTKIDDVEISEKIDDVFHKYITGKTGVVIERTNIHPFVVTLIREHNTEELIFLIAINHSHTTNLIKNIRPL